MLARCSQTAGVPALVTAVAVLLAVAVSMFAGAEPAAAATAAVTPPAALPYGDPTPMANPRPQYRGWVYYIPQGATRGFLGEYFGILQPLRPSADVQPIHLDTGSLMYVDGARGAGQMFGRPLGLTRPYLVSATSLWIARPLSVPASAATSRVVSEIATGEDLQLQSVVLRPLIYRNVNLQLAPGARVQLLGGAVVDGRFVGLFRDESGATAPRVGVGAPSWAPWVPFIGRRLCC